MALSKKKLGSTTLIFTAVDLAVRVLRNPQVQAQLRRAPETVKTWADERRDQRRTTGEEPTLERYNPLHRFGVEGLRRRTRNLRRTVNRLHDPVDPVVRAELVQAIDELDQALDFAAGLPRPKKRDALAQIEPRLDRLEDAFMQAVLAGSGPVGGPASATHRPVRGELS